MSKETGYKIKSAGKMRASIDMDGVIGWEIDSAQFKRDLKELGDIENIKITLNTEGGDVGQSVAIRNAIKEHPAKVHVHVVGYALSGGSYILTGADKVTATDDSMIMIHEPAGPMYGTADEMRGRADGLDVMTDAVVTGYVERMDSSEEEIRAMLKKTTWFTAAKAREAGLVDKLEKAPASTEPAQMRSTQIDVTTYKNAPPEFLTRYAQMRSGKKEDDGSAVETHEEGTHMTEERTYSEAELQAAVAKAAADAKAETESQDSVALSLMKEEGATLESVKAAMSMGLNTMQAKAFMEYTRSNAKTEEPGLKTEGEEQEPEESAEMKLLKKISSQFDTKMSGSDVNAVNKNASTDEDDKQEKSKSAAELYQEYK